MTWTREQIESEWLGAPLEALADRAASAIPAFDAVEKHLGLAWLTERRQRGGGVGPTLGAVSMGECLLATEALAGFDVLLTKLNARDMSPVPEMEAVSMFRTIGVDDVELAPDLQVGSAMKKPDLRVRRKGERWIYVEVTKPDTSVAAEHAVKLLDRLRGAILIERAFSMEIFLRTSPDETQEDLVKNAALELADSEDFSTVDLPGLAILVKAPFVGPVVSPIDHPGEDNVCPRFGAATLVTTPDGSKPSRIMCVRMPFSDERADALLKREAKQLSPDEQGLIIMDIGSTHGGLRNWKALIERRLQPNIHTRIGGVCLYVKGIELGHENLHHLFDYSILKNQHAPLPLPSWLFDGFRQLALDDDKKRNSPRYGSSGPP